jgi:hypothetical protein
MNIRHRRFTRVILALLAGIVASVVWESASAQITRGIGKLVVPIAGAVQAGEETIALSGQARVIGTLVSDPDFGGPPSVLLSIHLLNVSGVGQSTGTRYIATGEQRLIRLLRRSDLVEFTFPVIPVGAGGTALVSPALASFALDFDAGNERLRRATAKFATPDLPGLSSSTSPSRP